MQVVRQRLHKVSSLNDRVGFLADTFTAPKVIDMVGYWVWRCKIVGIWLYVHATVSPIIIASVMI